VSIGVVAGALIFTHFLGNALFYFLLGNALFYFREGI
jgi:hypothetical protein